VPPAILNFVVAYDGPAHVSTALDWLELAYRHLGIQEPTLPLAENQRLQTASPALDGIFLLGKGFTLYDNSPMTFIKDEHRTQHPGKHWMLAQIEAGSLFMLFLQIVGAVTGAGLSWLDPIPYLT